MEIDIIDLTADEYKDLNAVQLSMVRIAQVRKNKILSNAALKKAASIRRLVDNGFVRSTLFTAEQDRIDAEAEAEIEILKNDLINQLAYEQLQSTGNEAGAYAYPSNPNYYLSYSERFLVVRNYYMNRTSDPNARLAAYGADSLAREYLGEYYQTLYDLLASYCT